MKKIWLTKSISWEAAALLGLVLSLHILSRRYHTSASLERPTHFTVLALVTTGLTLLALRKFRGQQPERPPLSILTAPSATPLRIQLPARLHGFVIGRVLVKLLNVALDRVRRLRPLYLSLLLCVVARSVLFWFVIGSVQCSVSGLEAFLPLLVLCLEVTGVALPPSSPPYPTAASHPQSRPRSLTYALLACALGSSTVFALKQSATPTGTVCPVTWQWQLLPVVAQLLMCALDALILVLLSRLRSREVDEDVDASGFLARLFLAATVCMCLLSIPRVPTDGNFFWTVNLHYVDLRDLMVDSVVTCAAILCCLFLLPLLHSTSLALIVVSVGLLGFPFQTSVSQMLLSPSSVGSCFLAWAFTTAMVGSMVAFALSPPNSPRPLTTTSIHRWLLMSYTTLAAMSIVYQVLIPAPSTNLSVRAAIEELMTAAHEETEYWNAEASKSHTLQEAVAEYRRRYGISPPPNFDKWYAFAVENKSPIIDDYDQIYADLLPFWGMDPGVIRARTTHALKYSSLEMGGLQVRDGKLLQSSHIPGSHRWMTDTIERMMGPFIQWLPDMFIAINLSDECRVGVPYEEMELLYAKASATRSGMGDKARQETTASDAGKSPWPDAFPEPTWGETESGFTNNVRRQIYYDWVAATCPPDSRARNSHWWDWSRECPDCAAPHSLATMGGNLVSDAPLAGDLCHQPDVAFLHGFVMSPSVMVGTNQLFPIFSQGRLEGFSDILFPSPWNYNTDTAHKDEEDPVWADKKNGLFWRGSLSDGYAAFGTWAGFVRARFVHEAYLRWKQPSAGPTTDPLSINVSFTGGVSRCHLADCAAEEPTFRLWGEMTIPNDSDGAEMMDPKTHLPRPTPFEEHWKFRHLIDMDGAGFSGRLVPFLQSRSLVYRAALFHTWFDDRLRAWQHYVPVDVRLGRGFWSVVDYFAGAGGGDGESKGNEEARRIAEQGREWAARALRPEDMQVYMFRLLLEWGRVVQDDRERLGFDGA